MADGNLHGYELMSFDDHPSRSNYGCGRKIRVVQYVKNGKHASVKLERVDYFFDKATGATTHRPKGFTAQELEACRPHWGKIMSLLNNPPPLPTGD